MQKSRRNVIATLILLGCAIFSATGCGDESVASLGPVDDLVLFATGTAEERALEIVRLTETTIRKYPSFGSSPEYTIRVPLSHGRVEDGARFHRFAEVETVTLAVIGHFY